MGRADNNLTETANSQAWAVFPLKMERQFGRYRFRTWLGTICRFCPGVTNKLHSHDFFEVCLGLGGRGRFRHGGRLYEVGPGTLFLADPGVIHEIVGTEDPFSLIFLSFQIEPNPGPALTMDVLGESGGAAENLLERFLQTHDLVRENQGRLADYRHLLRPDRDTLILRETLGLMALEIMGALAPEPAGAGEAAPGAAPEPVQRARQFMLQNLYRQVETAEIAHAAGVSPRTLRRLFAEHCDGAPLEVFRRSRLARAAQYLQMNRRISEVAGLMGFSDPADFSRAFKQQYGQSPKVYQQKILRGSR